MKYVYVTRTFLATSEGMGGLETLDFMIYDIIGSSRHRKLIDSKADLLMDAMKGLHFALGHLSARAPIV
jgi:hypothetical protein